MNPLDKKESALLTYVSGLEFSQKNGVLSPKHGSQMIQEDPYRKSILFFGFCRRRIASTI